MTKKPLTPEVREYFREIGRKRGNALKEKYGNDYFKNMAAKRKTFGRRPVEKNSVTELSKRFGVSRQRMYQILETHGKSFDQTSYSDIGFWREAVAVDFFKDKPQK